DPFGNGLFYKATDIKWTFLEISFKEIDLAPRRTNPSVWSPQPSGRMFCKATFEGCSKSDAFVGRVTVYLLQDGTILLPKHYQATPQELQKYDDEKMQK